MRKVLWKRFVIFSLALGGVFIFNLKGIYNDGFVVRNYWIEETEHFIGGFLVTAWLISFIRSKKLIWGALTLVIISWEVMEFSFNVIPSLTLFLHNKLKISEFPFRTGDTLLDIFLGLLGGWLYLRFIRDYDKKRIIKTANLPGPNTVS